MADDRFQRFNLGSLYATPGALELLRDKQVPPRLLLARHARGDWGDLGPEDKAANDRATFEQTRIFSAYEICQGEKVWIITEADRAATTILLPSEY